MNFTCDDVVDGSSLSATVKLPKRQTRNPISATSETFSRAKSDLDLSKEVFDDDEDPGSFQDQGVQSLVPTFPVDFHTFVIFS